MRFVGLGIRRVSSKPKMLQYQKCLGNPAVDHAELTKTRHECVGGRRGTLPVSELVWGAEEVSRPVPLSASRSYSSSPVTLLACISDHESVIRFGITWD